MALDIAEIKESYYVLQDSFMDYAKKEGLLLPKSFDEIFKWKFGDPPMKKLKKITKKDLLRFHKYHDKRLRKLFPESFIPTPPLKV